MDINLSLTALCLDHITNTVILFFAVKTTTSRSLVLGALLSLSSIKPSSISSFVVSSGSFSLCSSFLDTAVARPCFGAAS